MSLKGQYGGDPVQGGAPIPNTTLDSLLGQLEYQLDRYADYTHDYYNVCEKLVPTNKETKSSGSPVETTAEGSFGRFNYLLIRLERLNDTNSNFSGALRTHI